MLQSDKIRNFNHYKTMKPMTKPQLPLKLICDQFISKMGYLFIFIKEVFW